MKNLHIDENKIILDGEFHSILSDIISMEQALNIPLLRREARILVNIKSNPGKSIKEIMIESGLSYGGFYRCLNVLSSNGLIKINRDDDDKRVKKIS